MTADESGELTYNPRLSADGKSIEPGMTKGQILEEQHNRNGTYAGWRIGLYEDMPKMPAKGKGKPIPEKGENARKQFEAGKMPSEYMRILSEDEAYLHESWITPEEWFVYFLTHLKRNGELIDNWQKDGKGCYSLAVQISGRVALLCWDLYVGRVGCYGRDAFAERSANAARSAVRIYP